MYYQKEMTTRWHDTDATLAVRPSALLVYMQEAALAQLDASGQNLDRLRSERGLAFILTRLSMRLYAPLEPLRAIRVTTWVGTPRGFNFPRYYRVEDAAGETVAEAASDWALYNLATHRPLRAGEFSYAVSSEEPLPFAPSRNFCKPDELATVGERRIGYSDIDYNGHMNNTRYPDMVCDFLPEGDAGCRRICRMELYFAKEAPMGATLTVRRGAVSDETGTHYLVRTENAAGETCLLCEVCCRPAAMER